MIFLSKKDYWLITTPPLEVKGTPLPIGSQLGILSMDRIVVQFWGRGETQYKNSSTKVFLEKANAILQWF